MTNATLLPPATKLGQGNIFRSVCPHSVHRGGMRGCSRGACMVAPGGMRGCSWGVCMVVPRGVCMVAPGGVCLLWGHVWLLPGGYAWLLWGGMCGYSGGDMCAWDMTRYGDAVNEQAVRILLECILVLKFIQLVTALNLSPLEVVQKYQHYQLCVSRKT